MSSALTRTATLGAIVALLTGTAFASPRPMLVVGGDHENPPYEYLENGKPTGFAVELMRAAAEIAGFDVQSRLGPWAQARRDLEEGKIDALSGMYFSEERSKLVDFSVPHTMVRSALFVREGSPIRSFADLRGKEVILQEGDVRHDLLQRTGIASRIIAVTDADDQLRLLASGRGDCALMTSRLQGEYYVKRLGLEKLRIIDADLPQLRYCFAVRKGNTELLDRLDEALNVLKVSGRYREIHERWFGVYEKTDLWKYGKYFAFALAILTALLAASLLWSRFLRRQVRLRTAELQRAQAELEQRVEERTAELRRANTQLRVSEAEKALVLNSTADLVTFLDPEMRIQWGNRQAAALARTTVDGLEGRRCFEAFHGRSTPCPGCPVVLAMKTGEPQSAEMSHPGEEIFLRAYPVKDEQGRVRGVAEFSLDITARKRMEEALRESEEWLKLTIEATGAGTFHAVPSGPPTFSPRHREMLGIPDDSAVADFEGFLRLVHPEDRERVRSGTEKALDPSGDGLLDIQFRCVRPDGSERWIARKAKAQFAEVGGARRAVRFAGVALDITERKGEEQALRESEARHARVAATVPGVLYEFARYRDGSGRFTYLSPRCPEILEVDGQALLDDFDVLYRMMDPADVRALEAGALAASRTRTSFSVEVRITTPSGRTKWIQFTSLPASTSPDGIEMRSGLILDVTERKMAEEELRETKEWLDLTIEATGAGTLHTVPFGGPATVSPRFREMFGLVDDAALQDFEAFLHIVHPDDRDRLREVVGRACDPSGDGLSEFEFRCVRPDDASVRWIAARSKTQFAEVEGVRRGARFAVVTLDITDRKREEEALRESEARHARLAATVPGVLYEFARCPDGTGRFRYLSARCSEILEVDGRDFLADLDRIVHPDDRRALREASIAASRDRTPLSMELRITTPSGRAKWVQFTSLSSSAPSEEVDRRSGLIIDISERKRMEEALRESEEWLKLTVEATGAGILNTVPFGPPTLSPRFREMLGLPDGLVIDGYEAFLSLVHPEDREEARDLTLRGLDPSGDGRFEGVRRFLRPDGSVRWTACTGKVQFAEVNGVAQAIRLASVHLDITDRKREEAALRESEERFHTLADNIAQLAWMADAQGEIVWFNRRCLDYTGAQADALQLGPFLHPDHVGRVAEKMSRSLSTGEVFEETFPLRGKDGRYRWFLSRAVPVRDGAGEVVRWLGTATDVTEQRDVEDALRESEARARAILASLAEGVILHDAEGRVTTANDAAEKLAGASREEMGGHTVFDAPPGSFLRPDGSPLLPEEHPVTLALRTGRGQGEVEFGWRRPGRAVIWLAFHAQPVRLPDGRVAGVVSSAFDVTQRRQALQRSEGHLRTMADSVPDSIIRFDRALRHSFANQAAAAVIGLPQHRLVGKTRGELGMTPEHVAFWDQYLLKVFRTGAPDRFEFGLDGAAGRHYESRLIPEHGPDGEIESVISITRDITERKQAEQQLLASREQLRALVARLNSVREEEKAQLSREIHDEMGQLLTALRMELEMIEDRLGDPGMPDTVRELLERAVAASELVAKTIHSMRSILSSLRPVALDRLGLEAALRQECRRFQEWAGVACELVATCGLSSFGTEVDTALFRIAQEALTNVARHAAASRVAVSLEQRLDAAVLRVADDGRGIPVGHESTGLGLLGMRERAERLGGELAVRPVPRGGTMVEARIPVDAATSRKEVT